MQFTDEVDWTALDFVFMGALLSAVGLGVELAVRKTRNVACRMGACTALAAAFLLIWISGAVGISAASRRT